MLPIRKLILLLTLLIVLGASENKAARILAVFPTPSISHQVVFRPIVQELVKRGHEVVVITPDPVFSKEESLKNLTEIDVHDLSYNIFADFFKNPVGSEDSSIGGLKTGYILCTNIFAHQMRTAEVQKILKEGNFDLLLLEAWFRPGMALSHIIKVPVILVSSFGGVLGMYESMGAPAHPFLYPDMFQQRIHQITLWEKLSELYKLHLLHKQDKEIMAFQLEIARDLFGKDVPDFPELYKNVDMMFLNVHPIFEFNRPVPPNIIYMGGLPQHSIKDLPKDLKSHLDSSKNGVIYISFGTNTKPSSFPKETMDTMLRVVSKLPYDVLFKWDSDELPQKPANVRISKWWPQADLLMHPKIKLFITQGGLQSTDEAITAGVPLIGIPMLGDQWYNVERYRGLGIGVRLDMDSITEDRLRDTINTVIEDESYRNNIVTLRSRMHDQPQSSLERAIWWTEYVLRHGGAKHLRSPAADISWSEYLELEMVLTILLLAAIIVLGLGLSLYYVYKYFFRNFLVDVKIKRT